jgi:Ca2+-binding RTX toxin-like protein
MKHDASSVLTLILALAAASIWSGQAEAGGCQGRQSTILGTPAGEINQGTQAPDGISGLACNGRLIGNLGNGIICGGQTNDVIFGSPGNDRLFGEFGNDFLKGGFLRVNAVVLGLATVDDLHIQRVA